MMYELLWDITELLYIRPNTPFNACRLVLQFLRKVILGLFFFLCTYPRAQQHSSLSCCNSRLQWSCVAMVQHSTFPFHSVMFKQQCHGLIEGGSCFLLVRLFFRQINCLEWFIICKSEGREGWGMQCISSKSDYTDKKTAHLYLIARSGSSVFLPSQAVLFDTE